MEIIVQTHSQEYYRRLKEHKPLIKRLFRKFLRLYATRLRRKLPEEIVLKPLRRRRLPKGVAVKSLTFGRAGYDSINKEWWIAMNMSVTSDSCFYDTLVHEVAHIGEGLISGKWDHGALCKKSTRGCCRSCKYCLKLLIFRWNSKREN